ncbi:response regulator transcription factor [Priestia aryabhattai]|uniref:response regulator transcription factor n=1 Tax=Priestia TaxID=2800373 RepID=UPI001455B66C|nr:response regulator transcription factor [Priestia aryabhattai]MBY0008132.1 response regulator transcription factor [Priestia aryabhattai]MBY0049947.1 response regulator transcription factor [Priestia aryabhattai]NLR46912.1 response regulator transcription factor [Priestia megaterium]
MNSDFKKKILIVDDDNDILNLLLITFRKEGYEYISTCSTAKEALEYVKKERYDLIILDVMLPDKTGFEIAPYIREYSNTPFFFLTAKKSDFDKLTGFAYGADDYITKPFNPLEIIARSKVIMKRTESLNLSKKLQQTFFDYEHFKLNRDTGELIVDNKHVECSAQIFQLLIYFCENPNKILTKEQLYENVWKENHKFIDNNTIAVYIYKLREKIEPNPKLPTFIQTVRGLGYKLVGKSLKV